MKAIALISGGLDSLLAAKVIQSQGIKIIPLHFKIPFCHYDKNFSDKREALTLLIKSNLGEDLRHVDIRIEFLEMLKNPRHGFGSNMNPCIDCKIMMLVKAKGLMEEWGASFVVTGEVLGQRPMSQHRHALCLIEKKSGFEGLLLRPLSARRLPETTPEKEGWVNRSRLSDFSGRTRQPQIELARSFDLRDYPNASGGCLLTDPEFTKRLKDLISHGELSADNIELLRYGRHFRLCPDAKLIVGRNEKENTALEKLAGEKDYLFYPGEELAGPTSLGRGVFNEELIRISCAITRRYCDLNGSSGADILTRRIPEKDVRVFKASRMEEEALVRLRIPRPS
ncbi:MAG: tRNA 4-thiouridine(8) synthase ThiI [Candidatus Omnitrophota bacterium]